MANKNYETSAEFVEHLKDLQEKTERALTSMEKLLTIASQVVLEKKSILNDQEDKIFQCFVSTKYGILNTKEYPIHPQVSMSAFIKNKNSQEELANQCWYLYNKLYVDFLIVKRDKNKPICVIEYNGGGHNKEVDGRARDMVKKTICEKAKIPFIVLKSIEGKEINEIKDYIKKEIVAKGLDYILRQQ